MRKILHYLKIGIIIIVVLTAYCTVVLLVIYNWNRLSPPVGVSLITAGAAIITSIFVLVRDLVIDFINKPRLIIHFIPNDKRDCHTTEFHDHKTGKLIAKAHYFRLRIENIGWKSAEDVEVTLEEVKRFEDGQFIIDNNFPPLRFVWSHWKGLRYEITIPAGVYRHCDLGFILEPDHTEKIYASIRER